MNYFANCKNLDELKLVYRGLAKMYHPDHGGDTATMQTINAQYSDCVKHYSKYGKVPQSDRRAKADHARGATPANVQRAITLATSIPGVTVELVGLWVWVSGNTYPHRETLKANGFKWASKKSMWYFAGVQATGRGMPMDYIRNKYGSETVDSTMRLLESK